MKSTVEDLTDDEKAILKNLALVGLPHNGNVTTPYFLSMLNLFAYELQKLSHGGLPNVLGLWDSAGCYVAANRNAIMEKFLTGTRCSWLLMIDPDISFPHTLLDQMLEDAEGKEVLFAPVLLMRGTINLFRREKPGVYRPYEKITHGDIFEIDAAGTGVVLIHRSAAEKLKACYPGPWHWFGHDQVGDKVLGDDITFSRRCRAQGIKLWGWCKVMPVHHKRRPVGFMGGEVVDYDPRRIAVNDADDGAGGGDVPGVPEVGDDAESGGMSVPPVDEPS